jgi:hypothetical protein
MTDSERRNVASLLHEAKQLAPGEREVFVGNISDADVRAEVCSLLAADSNGSDIVDPI